MSTAGIQSEGRLKVLLLLKGHFRFRPHMQWLPGKGTLSLKASVVYLQPANGLNLGISENLTFGSLVL